jgi:uncharacterized membrane protein
MEAKQQPQPLFKNMMQQRAQPLNMGSGMPIFGTLMPQTMANPMSMPLQAFNPFKQASMMPQKDTSMSGGMNYMSSNPNAMATEPMIMLQNNSTGTNKPSVPSMQSSQMGFQMPNQQSNYSTATTNQTTYNTNTFVTNGFNNGSGMPGMVSYGQPMQIQYMTSLYCPYSNNNIFSNYYPVVCQPNQGFMVPTSSEKQGFGMETMSGGNSMGFSAQQPNNMMSMSNGYFKGGERFGDQNSMLMKHERENEAGRY